MRLLHHLFIIITAILLCTAGYAQQPSNCVEKIIDIQQWKETASTRWNFFKQNSTGGAIAYIGAQHKDDPNDAQFKQIQMAFDNFKPAIVFYEGPDRGIAESDTLTIQKFGESGYARWLAKKRNIPVMSLEPAFNDTYQFLLSKFPQEQVDVYMFAKEASRLYHRKKMTREQIAATLQQMIPQLDAMTITNKPVLRTVPQVDSAFKKYITTAVGWWEAPEDWFDPAKTATAGDHKFTNTLAALSSGYRNIYMVQLLAKQVNDNKKVFAVVGRNHVPLQEPALDCAIR